MMDARLQLLLTYTSKLRYEWKPIVTFEFIYRRLIKHTRELMMHCRYLSTKMTRIDIVRKSGGVPDHNANAHGKTCRQTAIFLQPASQNQISIYIYLTKKLNFS